MKARIRPFLCTLLVLSAVTRVAASDEIGEAVYLEGDVLVVRNSVSMDPSDVQIGMGIENFDLMKTDSHALAEVKITAAKAPPMTIKVAPATQFSFEISKLGGTQQSSIGLITGSLTMKVSKLTGAQDVQVKTETAAMGVRGTEFTVTSPPSGDILVTCGEGEVVCTDENGSRLRALPGTAIERRAGETLRAIPVAVSDLETFRNNWVAERIEALKANALRATRDYVELYDSLSAELAGNYSTLMKNQTTLTKWYREDTQGNIGGTMELMREKKAVIGSLFKLRKTLFRFERIYYRLLELEDYHDQGYGKGLIRSGVSTDQFFARMERERNDLERKMATIRYVAKLYALRNGGGVPTGAFDENEASGGDDFFGS